MTQSAQPASKGKKRFHPDRKADKHRRAKKTLVTQSESAAHPFPFYQDPWTEIVGTVERVQRTNLFLECRTLLSIDCPVQILTKYKKLLKKGNAVGIVIMESDIRIRQITEHS
jgi:hypothetical protein